MNFTTMELASAKIWASEHADGDDPLDLYHWKLLSIGLTKAERSAGYHARTVGDVKADKDSLSMKFYEADAEAVDPGDDPEIVF